MNWPIVVSIYYQLAIGHVLENYVWIFYWLLIFVLFIFWLNVGMKLFVVLLFVLGNQLQELFLCFWVFFFFCLIFHDCNLLVYFIYFLEVYSFRKFDFAIRNVGNLVTLFIFSCCFFELKIKRFYLIIIFIFLCFINHFIKFFMSSNLFKVVP